MPMARLLLRGGPADAGAAAAAASASPRAPQLEACRRSTLAASPASSAAPTCLRLRSFLLMASAGGRLSSSVHARVLRRRGCRWPCMAASQRSSKSQASPCPAELPAARQRACAQLVHFVGIGGAGLSALALVALQQGWQVSGSDAVDSDRLHNLREAGADVYVGHSAAQLTAGQRRDRTPDALVASSAIAAGNEEVEAAIALGIPIYNRREWLGKLTAKSDLIAVAGSHGKSTTTAMLALTLRSAGVDLTAVVGGEVPQFPRGSNAMVGKGPLFVLEADEYDSCFLGVSPAIAVITNVEWEHVDYFPTEAAVREAFLNFARRLRPGGTLVVCGDSAGSKRLGKIFSKEEEVVSTEASTSGSAQTRAAWLDDTRRRHVITYGLSDCNDWRACMLVPNPQGGTDYVVVHKGQPMARVNLPLPGTYNVLNSLAVVVVVALLASRDCIAGDESMRLDLMKRAAAGAAQFLKIFKGVRRRFEQLGQTESCIVINDYAHHPTEVRATLQGARQRFDQQPIWVIFQPHTFSRLAKLLKDFAPAFSAADWVIITEVYAAREQDILGVDGSALADAIIGPPALYIPKQEEVLKWLILKLRAYAIDPFKERGKIVVLILGAGDNDRLGSQLLSELQSPS
eukprot:SM000045S16281  [mRNA]  locus=s45:655945:660413:- [translate_table: standard]